MKQEFWNSKRVLLTGHTGFKGGWLALWLDALGAEVTGFALPPPEGAPSLFAEAGVSGALHSRLGDLRDPAAVAAAVEAADPQIVLHLAAQSLVREGYAEPVGTFATNVLGTAHLLEALRRRPALEVVLVVTSDKCYDNREWEWGYRESDPLGGKDPYSASKAGTELVAAAYRDSFLARAGDDRPVGVATARSGNVIGGGDWAADRLLPDLARGFAAGETVAIRSPDATRPWQHVLDPLAGYLLLAERLWQDRSLAGAWNFGPGEDGNRPVRWVADRAAELWGGGAGWRQDDEVHPPEANFLQLDASKARRRLAWRPRLSLLGALEWTLKWYRAHREGEDAGRLTRAQIEAYAGLEPGADGSG